jgi:hypothetical protein
MMRERRHLGSSYQHVVVNIKTAEKEEAEQPETQQQKKVGRRQSPTIEHCLCCALIITP